MRALSLEICATTQLWAIVCRQQLPYLLLPSPGSCDGRFLFLFLFLFAVKVALRLLLTSSEAWSHQAGAEPGSADCLLRPDGQQEAMRTL